MNKTFEEIYKKEKCFWGINPDKYVAILSEHVHQGRVLDLGAGEGRNSIYLAQKGFDVTAVDISQNGLEKINKIAKENRIVVKTLLADLSEYQIDDIYDIIISSATLHFLNKEHVDRIINQMQKNTKIGGINGISVFNCDNESPKPYLFKKGELVERYKNWKIIGNKEFITPLEKHGEDGKLHRHGVSIIIAQKEE